MNTDFRLNVNYVDHPKLVILRNELGVEAQVSHLRLLQYTAVNKPSGFLTGVSDRFIESAAGWKGTPGAFVASLTSNDIRLLDVVDGGYYIHDWAEHNAWAAAAFERELKARFAALTKHHGKPYAEQVFADKGWPIPGSNKPKSSKPDYKNADNSCYQACGSSNEVLLNPASSMPVAESSICPVSVSVSVSDSVSVSVKPQTPCEVAAPFDAVASGALGFGDDDIPAETADTQPADETPLPPPQQPVKPSERVYEPHPLAAPAADRGKVRESAIARFCERYKFKIGASYRPNKTDMGVLGHLLWRLGSVDFDKAVCAYLASDDPWIVKDAYSVKHFNGNVNRWLLPQDAAQKLRKDALNYASNGLSANTGRGNAQTCYPDVDDPYYDPHMAGAKEPPAGHKDRATWERYNQPRRTDQSRHTAI